MSMLRLGRLGAALTCKVHFHVYGLFACFALSWNHVTKCAQVILCQAHLHAVNMGGIFHRHGKPTLICHMELEASFACQLTHISVIFEMLLWNSG